MTADTEFNWDARSAQPLQLGGKVDNFLSGIRHAIPMAGLAMRNAIHLPSILMKYRRYCRSIPQTVIPGHGIGISIGSFDYDNPKPELQALQELNAGSLFCRVLSWEEASYESMAELIKASGYRPESVAVAFVQDRQCIVDLNIWKSRLQKAVEIFSPLCDAFQIGHAPNRKKWGFRNHREFADFCKVSCELKPEGLRYIGPSTLDFEIMYTDAILQTVPGDTFDIFNTLLYVDRRGAPEKTQWPSYDTGNKTRLMRAIADINGYQQAPMWITEVNWPIENTGKYAPTGRKLRVSEEDYAAFLARYYVLAFQTGLPERICWWELAAYGYGLIDNHEGAFRKRPGFAAMRTICRLLPGYANKGVYSRNGMYAAVFGKSDATLIVIWNMQKESRIMLKTRPQALINLAGDEVPVKDEVPVGPAPLFCLFEGEMSEEEAFTV